MNNNIKRIVLILLAVVFAFTLSGCDIVGNARSTQAFIQEKDGVSSILYGNTEYNLLPSSDNLSPLLTDYDNIIYVTEPDVPVLLSYFLGDAYNISDDGIFLLSAYDMSGGYYCRADKYDEILKALEGDFNATDLCYSYYCYDENDNYIEERTKLTSNESSAILSVFSNVEYTAIPEIANLNYDYLVEVYACSSDTLFMEHYTDIVLSGDEYYLIVYDEQATLSYKVPEAEATVISEIVNTVMNADEFYYDYEEEF